LTLSPIPAYPRILAVTVSIAVDSLYYRSLVFTPINFFRENVLRNISVFYGSNVWHFYLTQAIPVTTWTLLPFVLYGAFRVVDDPLSNEGKRRLVDARHVCVWTIVVYSLLAHKEFRFIQPLLPLFHVFAAHALISLSDSFSSSSKKGRKESSGGRSRTTREGKSKSKSSSSVLPRTNKLLLATIALSSVAPALYLICWHARGQIDVVRLLSSASDSEVKSVGFLMPCHSTPWQSHLHRADLEVEVPPAIGDGNGSGEGGRLWFITCEPPIRSVQMRHHLTPSLFR
jgi:phosphatidylinositol glycan class B